MRKIVRRLFIICMLISLCLSAASLASAKVEPQLVIPPQFDDITYFEDGIAFVRINGRWGIIDTKGEYIVKPKYEDTSFYEHEGYIQVKRNGKWGFIDRAGTETIVPTYEEMPGNFSGGRASVKVDGYWGFIDEKGQIAIKPNYLEVSNFSNGTALAISKTNTIVFIDAAGKVLADTKLYYGTELQYSDPFLQSDYVWLRNEAGQWGFYSKNGKQIVPPTYTSKLVYKFGFEQADMSHPNIVFNEGKAIVSTADNKRVVINEQGKTIPALKSFDGSDNMSFGLYSDGRAAFCFNLSFPDGFYSLCGFVDEKGNEINTNVYEDLYPFSEGKAAVKDDSKLWGFIDKQGKTVIPHTYEQVTSFIDGLAWVSKNGKWGIIDKAGKVVLPIQYELDTTNSTGELVFGFADDLAFVKKQDGSYIYVDRKGQEAFRQVFEQAWHFGDGLGGVRVNGKWGFIAKPPLQATAKPTSSKVNVNGKEIAFEAYNINGNNYFKLRDLAMALNGSEKEFEVGWDSDGNAITLTMGQTYTSVGGELKPSQQAIAKQANPTGSKVYLNGQQIALTAYHIAGNNYFKLRDLGAVLNFGIDWDATSKLIAIDTGKEYTAE